MRTAAGTIADMRTGKAIALVVALLLAAPAGAAARSDEQVRRDAAALPQRLWEPAPEPVSASGPSLANDAGGVVPVLAALLLLGAAGVGYMVGVLRPSRAAQTAAPAPDPQPLPMPIVTARSRRFARRKTDPVEKTD